MSPSLVLIVAIVPAVVSAASVVLVVRALRELRKLRQYGYPYEQNPYAFDTLFIFDLHRRIDRYQDLVGIQLTTGARQMLLIPVVEAFGRGERPDLEAVDRSLEIILSTMRQEPESLQGEEGRIRSSISVIRAFWKNFCNIPPFCSSRERS